MLRPISCLITDRRRTASIDDLVNRVAVAARAGVNLVQIRERDLDGGPLLDLTRQCVAAVRGTAARVLVNDRADVAVAAGAHGVHLRGDSMPAVRVRSLVARGFLVGRSVHSVEEAAAATRSAGLDYLLFGAVFATRSKPGRDPSGVAMLAAVCGITTLPVLAVGGITAPTVRDVMRAGAAGWAAIGLFADGAIDALPQVLRDAGTGTPS